MVTAWSVRRGAVGVTIAAAIACAPSTNSRPSPLATRPSQWADSVLATLSPRDKAAQLVWPQLFGDYTPTSTEGWIRVQKLIAEQHVGGFIMSIGSPIETAVKINAMQRLSALPLLLGADYETGVAFRQRGGYFLPNNIYLGGGTMFPYQMGLGATRDTSLAYQEGRITAIEGRALGVHVAFAPVLDVNNNPANPVIGMRSFGEDPHLVADMGSALIHGLQEHGMVATGKHFPGHGDTDENSHLVLSTVHASRARIDSVELVPFRRAIASGVQGMMTFHGLIPSIDTASVPATLNPRIMTGLLRQQLGFKGLLITDAMDMNGVLARVSAPGQAAGGAATSGSYGGTLNNALSIGEACKLAIAAGADILLMPSDVPASIDAVIAGVREGRFTQARVDSSVRRVLMMKEQLDLDRRRLVDLDSVRSLVGDTSHTAVAAAIAQRAITLAKDSLSLVPLARVNGQPSRVLSITIASRTDLPAGATFNAELRRGATVRTELVYPDDPSTNYARLLAAADSADVAVVSSYISTGTSVSNPSAPEPVAQFMRDLVQRHPRTIVVAFGNPYLLQQVPAVSSYVVAWGGFPVSQAAAGRAIIGAAPIGGRLPISIPPVLHFGAGYDRLVSPRASSP